VPDDAPATLALFRLIVEEGRYTLSEPDEVTATEHDERRAIINDAADPGRLRLVLEAGGEVVGTVRVEAGRFRRTRHFGDLDSLWVHPQWRRRGVADLLLRAVIDWARHHPELEKLGLFVFSTNSAAIRLYEKHGFVIEGRYPRDMKLGEGEYVDTLAMGLLVKPRVGRPGSL
jgi:RimJ/RimL family protein N-acetyltransferase